MDDTHGSGSILPYAGLTPFFTGDYTPSVKREVYLNPLASTVNNADWKWNEMHIEVKNAPSSTFIPGTIGNFIYHPTLEGPFKLSQTETVDSTIIADAVRNKYTDYTRFSVLWNIYRSKVVDYN